MYDSGDDWFYVKPVTEIDVGRRKLHFASVEWEVHDFSRRGRRADEEIRSPDFICGDAWWLLSVFPNGQRCNGTVGIVNICLTKVSPGEFTVFSEISIVLNDERRELVLKGEITLADFCDRAWKATSPRVDVLRRDNAYLKDDTLTISCHLFVFGNESPEIPSIAVAKNLKDATPPQKKDAGTETSSKDLGETPPEKKNAETNTSIRDFGNLLLYKDQPTTKEENLTSISTDFEELYNNQRFADVILKLGKYEFPVHKVILRSRSKVFEAMFEHDMQENRQDTVDLVDMEADTVKDMLRYIYCGKVRQLSPEEALNLYVAADRYDLQELLLHCRKIILNTLSVDNLCEVSAVADLHNDQLLTDEVKYILCKNMKEILKTDKWVMFAKENPILSLNLMRSAILSE